MIKDPYGRPITSLRISITQRCNLNCFYCHHEGEDGINEGEMTADEIGYLGRIAADLGIRKVKITGGEPLVRSDITEIIHSLSNVMDEVSLTTNGTLLAEKAEELRDAGLARVNVSLDSLDPEKYMRITGHPAVGAAVNGIKSAIRAGLNPVKINMVLLKGVNEDEVEDMIDFSAQTGAVLQIIEFETTRDGEKQEEYRKYHADLSELEIMLEKKAHEIRYNELHRRRKYLIETGGGHAGPAEVEIVRPMHNSEFCANCRRIRITSDGWIRGCLLTSRGSRDVLSGMRKGNSDRMVKDIFREVIGMRRPYWTRESRENEARNNEEGETWTYV